VRGGPGGSVAIEAFQSGRYLLKTARARRYRPTCPRCRRHWRSPARGTSNFRPRAAHRGRSPLARLVSWSEHSDAGVKLNSRGFDVLWKPPFCVDVTDAIRADRTCWKCGWSTCGSIV